MQDNKSYQPDRSVHYYQDHQINPTHEQDIRCSPPKPPKSELSIANTLYPLETALKPVTTLEPGMQLSLTLVQRLHTDQG